MGHLDELLFEHERDHSGDGEPYCVFCDIVRIANALENIAVSAYDLVEFQKKTDGGGR